MRKTVIALLAMLLLAGCKTAAPAEIVTTEAAVPVTTEQPLTENVITTEDLFEAEIDFSDFDTNPPTTQPVTTQPVVPDTEYKAPETTHSTEPEQTQAPVSEPATTEPEISEPEEKPEMSTTVPPEYEPDGYNSQIVRP